MWFEIVAAFRSARILYKKHFPIARAFFKIFALFASEQPPSFAHHAPGGNGALDENDILPDPSDTAPRNDVIRVPAEQPQKPAGTRNHERRAPAGIGFDAKIAAVSKPRALADVDDLLVAEL